MSLAVPVSEPSGSPLDLASALGTGAPATSASVTAFGTAAGVAAGVCARLSGAQQQSTAKHNVSRVLLAIFILVSPLFPDCILYIGSIEYTHGSEQTDSYPEDDDCKSRPVRTQSHADDTDYKTAHC